MPQWTIYKNDFAIGQAKTWHKSLDILVKQEGLNDIGLMIYSHFVIIFDHRLFHNHYKIQKEA